MTTRIGLEVHVPLATDAKLFCRCPAHAPEEANHAICPTCTGQPGARPQGINERALEAAVTTTQLLGCTLADTSVVQRKHYVYPDLPNNYQRTTTPLGEDGRFWEVGILEAHLEEDPGTYDPGEGLVDLNRSGTPLVEVVTAPDLTDPEDVVTWLRVLRLTLERQGLLREGAELKADVNVSTAGGDRVEVKNVVGARNAARAAAYEVDRQTQAREQGQTIPMETRGFDEATATTHAMRRKETVGDYRYMPDPDLHSFPPGRWAPASPALARVPAKLKGFMGELGLELGEALALLEDGALEEVFDRLRREVSEDLAVEIGLSRLRSELDYREARLDELDVEAGIIVELSKAWDGAQITKQVFTRLLRQALDGEQVRDALEAEKAAGEELDLSGIIRAVIEEHPEPVNDYLGGNEAAVNFLVGQVMAKTQGRADAKQARAALVQALDAG